jgi:hypothetical protein
VGVFLARRSVQHLVSFRATPTHGTGSISDLFSRWAYTIDSNRR